VDTFADTVARNFITGQDALGTISLRSATEAANSHGGVNTINVPAGTYNLILGQVSITNNLTITGAAVTGTALNGTLVPSTIINAGFTSRIFQIPSGFTVTISNVTLEQGAVIGTFSNPAQGGAIFDSGSLTLKNDTLFENFTHGAAGAAGPAGANGVNAISGTQATAGSPGGKGQPGGDAEGGAIYLDNAPGAGLSIINCALNNNFVFQGTGGRGGQGGSGGSNDLPIEFNGDGAAGGAGGNGGPGGNAFGGGVYNAGGSLVIQNSVFSGNSAGISAFFIFPVVGGGTGGGGGSGGAGGFVGTPPSSGGTGGNGGNGGFAGDDRGGAVYNSGGGSVTILTSSFSGNEAFGEQGGTGGVGGSAGFADANFAGLAGTGGTGGSTGDGIGGAISNFGTMKIDSSSFFSNQAIAAPGGTGGTGGTGGSPSDPFRTGGNGGNGGSGGFGGAGFAGAIESFSGILTLTHNSISLNSAGSGAGGNGGSGGAGGTGKSNGPPGNAGSTGSPGHGGDGGVLSVFATTQVFDTIIAGNTGPGPGGPDVDGRFTSLGHNLIGQAGPSSSGFPGSGDQVGTSTNPINPLLSVVGNFLVPQVGSPALQAGDPTSAPATDERGLPRIVNDDANLDSDGPQIDIGAVEFQPSDLSITVSRSPSSVGPGGIITYTITIKTGNGDNPSVNNLTLTDAVPAQTTFQSFTAPGGWAVTAPNVGQTGTVTATFLSLAPSSTASFTLQVRVNSSVTASSTTDAAKITTTSPDPTTADNSASVKTTILVGWLAVGADAGGELKVYDPQNGTLRFDFLAFYPNFHGGVRTAVGDVNGDGIPDIIAAQGPSDGSTGDSLVHVYDGTTGQQLAGPLGSFDPFPGFHGGLYVASADLNGDGFFDVVVAEDTGGQPRVRVFSGKDGSLLDDFLAFTPDFTGGVRVAAGDVNHDGHADIVAAAGPGGAPRVEVFEGSDLAQGVAIPRLSFDAYEPGFTGGVYVATGDVHGDGIRKILTGEGPGGQPRVSVFDGITGAQLQTFLAFQPGFHGGVRVAAADVNGDGRPDIIAAEGPGGLPLVRGFDGLSLQEIYQLRAFDSDFRGGVFVGGGGLWPVLHPAQTQHEDQDPDSNRPVTAAQFSVLDSTIPVLSATAARVLFTPEPTSTSMPQVSAGVTENRLLGETGSLTPWRRGLNLRSAGTESGSDGLDITQDHRLASPFYWALSNAGLDRFWTSFDGDLVQQSAAASRMELTETPEGLEGCELVRNDASSYTLPDEGLSPTGVEPVTFGSGENWGSTPRSPKNPVASVVYERTSQFASANEHAQRVAKRFGISAPCAEDSALAPQRLRCKAEVIRTAFL
jgi:uncharacterized repeat protein (TIGR01451 family)